MAGPHMGDSFTLSYTDSGLNSNSSLVLSLDPLKAERLEHRLTAGGNVIPSTSTSTPAIATPPPSAIEKEDLNSDDELSYRGSDDNSNPRREDGSRSLKARRRFTKIEDDTLLEGHNKFGTEWDKIVSWGNLDRTVEQLKRRFTRIRKRQLKGEEGGSGREDMPRDSSTEPPKKMQKLNPPSPGPVDIEPVVPKKEWEELKAQQEELKLEKERLQLLQNSLNEKEQGLAKREQMLKNYEETIQTRLRQTLEGLLIEQAERDREEAKRTVMKNCTRLGQLIFERHGTLTTEYHEVWRDGSAFKELKKKRDNIAAERNAIENQRKQLKKSRANKTASEGPEGLGDEHILQQEEILRIRLQALKKEESDLNSHHSKLLFEKKLHLREMKRCSDEENSRFNTHPTLNARYLLLNLLGKGGFSEVYKAYDLVEFRLVACKIHQLNTNWSESKKQNYTKHAVREYNIHKDLNHPGVVSLYDVFKIDNNSFCTVLEYCDGGDLDLYLKTRNKLQEREAKVIVAQIFSGLKYLNMQKRPIIHYDLKPGNILFSDGAVKITDFGLSKIMEENSNQMELTSQGAGTYWYLPPECFEVGKAPPRISSKVDVWSAGVIFYQLLYGKKPFGNNCSQQKLLVDQVITNATAVDFPSRPSVSQQGKNFIRRCLTPSQTDRPDVLTICEDPYLKIVRQPKNKKGDKESDKKED